LRYPNLFVMGAAKSGTTTLHSLLSVVDDIYMSGVKEPHFLAGSDVVRAANRPKNASEYLALFRNTGQERYLGESSASYLWSAQASRHTLIQNSQSKLMVILRDPVERMVSQYWMDVRGGIQSVPIQEAFAQDLVATQTGWNGPSGHLYWEISMYGHQLKRYLRARDDGRLLILTTQELAQPRELALKLSNFLDVEVSSSLSLKQENSFSRPRGRIAGKVLSSPRLRRLSKKPLGKQLRPLAEGLLTSSRRDALDLQLISQWRSHFTADGEILRREIGLSVQSDWY